MTPERQKRIDQEKLKIAQAQARIQQIMAQENTENRKKRNRQKFILGGLILQQAKTSPQWHKNLMRLIQSIKREQDKKVFEGFTFPAPAAQAKP